MNRARKVLDVYDYRRMRDQDKYRIILIGVECLGQFGVWLNVHCYHKQQWRFEGNFMMGKFWAENFRIYACHFPLVDEVNTLPAVIDYLYKRGVLNG